MRIEPSSLSPCTSFEPGHGHDPQAGAGYPIRSGNWVPAHLKVVVEYRAGRVVMLYVEGVRQRFFAHDLFTIHRLLQPARAVEPLDFGALFNEQHQVVAIPRTRFGGPELACFSLSRDPLTPCLIQHDQSLAREFEAVTAGLRCG